MVNPGKVSGFGVALSAFEMATPRPMPARGHRRDLAKPSSNRKAALLAKALKRQARGG